MSKRLVSQVSFSYGEVDAVNFNRTELGEYLQAARSLKNMTIGLTQLTRKRAGTTQVFNITNYANTAIKMFKLQDKDNNFYVIFMVPMAAHVFKLGNNTLTFVSSLTVPYEADYIQSLQSASAIESLFTVSEKYAPSRVYIKSYSPTPTFAFENLNFSVKPSFDFRKINYGDFARQAPAQHLRPLQRAGTGRTRCPARQIRRHRRAKHRRHQSTAPAPV